MGKTFKIGKGLTGQYIGVIGNDDSEHILDVYYCHQKVLELSKIHGS